MSIILNKLFFTLQGTPNGIVNYKILGSGRINLKGSAISVNGAPFIRRNDFYALIVQSVDGVNTLQLDATEKSCC